MKSYKKMYVSSYSQENFYVDKFEMGADAYREGYDGVVERLRIVSILSTNRFEHNVENLSDDLSDCYYDYNAIFNNSSTTRFWFVSDGEIDELPEIDEIIYC